MKADEAVGQGPLHHREDEVLRWQVLDDSECWNS